MTANSTAIQVRSAPFHLSSDDVDWVEDTLASLTLDEKVGQLFTLIATSGDEEALTNLVRSARPGGVMFRPMHAEEVIAGVRTLREESRLPILIAANLERGGDGIAHEGTSVGSLMQVAATGRQEAADWLGTVSGREAGALGVNWAFAPVVDIDMNFRNPITNTRTFGSDPTAVRDLSVRVIGALQSQGLAACPKHFPGDGVDERDQHLVASCNDLSCEAWDATFGEVYRACIAAGAKTIMVGHILQPAWSRRLQLELAESDILPASLSPELINGLLRGRLGFNGLVVSDASTMAGMASALPRSKLVPRSIAAGCDMLLFTRNLTEDLQFMHSGIASGMLTVQRLDEAVTRILALKASLRLHQPASDSTDPKVSLQALQHPDHEKWAGEVARSSITLVKNDGHTLPLDPTRHRRVLFHDLHLGDGFFDSSDRGADRLLVQLLEAEGFEVSRFEPPTRHDGDTTAIQDTIESFDLILYLARLATRSNQTTVRIEWKQPMGSDVPILAHSIPTVFVSVENPYHLLDVPRVPVYINTYSPTDATIYALVEKLRGRSPFEGVSPVDPFCGRWDARLS